MNEHLNRLLAILAVFLFTASVCSGQCSRNNCCTAFSCAGSSDVVPEEPQHSLTTECYGYASCVWLRFEVSTTLSQVNLACGGSRSCQNLFYLSAGQNFNIDANGYLSLAFSQEVSQVPWFRFNRIQGSLRCNGEGACNSIQSITSSYIIDCSGARSCANLPAASVTILEGGGAYSLMNSNFYSFITDVIGADDDVTIDQVEVRLYGYFAGYGASFYCLAGYSCDVDCGINGCVNFNYYCDENAITCTVSCNDDTVICPNGWSNGVYTGDFSGNTAALDLVLVEDIFETSYSDSLDLAETLNCNSDALISALGCEPGDYEGCSDSSNLPVIDESLCINAFFAFFNSDLTMSSSSSGDSNTVYCDSERACFFTSFNLGQTNSIACRGESACSQTKVNDFKNVVSTGDFAFFGAEATNGDSVTCFGVGSCRSTTFTSVGQLFGLGEISLDGATIISGGKDVTVYLFGVNSGSNLKITCSVTDVCTIIGLNDDFAGLDESNVVCDDSNACTIEYLVVVPTTQPSLQPTLETSFPTPQPTEEPTEEPISSDNCFFDRKFCDSDPCSCDDVENCDSCSVLDGCTTCSSGYWKVNSGALCVSCDIFGPKCESCADGIGCVSCGENPDVDRYFDSDCNVWACQ